MLSRENAALVESERRIRARAGDLDRYRAAAAVALEERIDELEQHVLDAGRRIRHLHVHEERAFEIDRLRHERVVAGKTHGGARNVEGDIGYFETGVAEFETAIETRRDLRGIHAVGFIADLSTAAPAELDDLL